MGYVWMTAVGISFIFLMTALGASVVYFFKGELSQKVNALFCGLASGIMLAASVWSLLLPALEEAKSSFGTWAFLPVSLSFLAGCGVLTLLHTIFPVPLKGTDGKTSRLFFAVTLHNIPEGLAVGFAFGVAGGDMGALFSALALAVGIGVQNFPEGAAISLPMHAVTKNKHKAFLWGAASGVVEPPFAIAGYFLAAGLRFLQPWLLALSAGAMVFVVAGDLLPDAKCEESPWLGAWGAAFGFALMMALDLALG